MRRTVLLSLVLPLLACGERLTPQSEVDKLRVLAMRADRPEVRPGETVTVEVLWADPEGDDRPVGFGWIACTIGSGADPRSCTEAGAEVTPLGLGLGMDEVGLEVPADALEDGRDEAVVLVVVLVCAGGLPELRGNEEIACPPPEAESARAYKRITVSLREGPNENPRIRSISFGGRGWGDGDIVSVDTCPSGDCPGYEVILEPESDAAETYVDEAPGGPTQVEEELLVSFFATGGELDRVRSADPQNLDFRAGWRAPPSPGIVTMWFVLRDGRGGITWAQRTARAAP